MERWVSKVAIVTGASAGIGACIAEKLVKEGLQVVGFARRKEKVEELSRKLKGEKGKLYALKVDVSKEDEVVSAFKWVENNVGSVHILVNNAGCGRVTTLLDGDYQKWKEVLDTNVLGLCVATREAVRNMRKNNIDGHIIHINSITGHKVPSFPGFNIYPSSKFAVTALAETLRHEFNSHKLKIKITSISPGVVKTDFFDVAGFDHLSAQDVESLRHFPSLNPDDIADGVLYVLGTPSHVLIQELTIKPLWETIC